MAVTGLGALFLLMALGGCGFCIHAGGVLGRYAPGPERRLAAAWPVTLIKPLHGAEPHLKEALTTFLRQSYAAPVEMRLGLQADNDPALAVARALQEGEGAAVRVVLDPEEHGANHKVSNLINLARAAPLAELVVQSDSDIVVRPDYLAKLAAALAPADVGVASCLYFGEPAAGSLAARLGAMGVSYASLPLFAVGVSTGAKPCMGSTIALRRGTLEAIGGFEAVKDVLADDYEIGARVRALGLDSVVPPFLVAHHSAEATLGELWRHELRWSKTVMDINPAGHVGSVVTHPVALALLGWALIGLRWPGLLILAAALCARLWLKSRVDRVAGANGQAAATGPWWLLPVRDIMGFAVFVGAFFARRVEWRGARFHVGKGGGLTPV